jgi:DNA helicase-2/ATP-dependent DNA helicase PcrA
MKSVLEGLNAPQLQAVKQVEGPLLILAGAGSGKTKTLTHRIAYLIGEHNVSPANILAVTFTNKAAGEMRERVAHLLDENADNRSFMPFMGTFHSIGVRLLRRDGDHIGIPQNFVIFDESDRTGIIKEIMKNQRVSEKQFPPRQVGSIISSAKNELMDPKTYEPLASSPLQKVAAAVYPVYEKRLREAMALDFDDLIGQMVRLLEDVPQVRERWQQQFKYVLIDEYQDTNAAQYKLVKLLIGKNKNICVVGDDWQSIYSWRGADYRNILNFEKDYPDTTIVKLEQNYRSTSPILEAANQVITKNKQRSDKKLWTDKTEGLPVHIEQVSDERREAEFIIRKVKPQVDIGARNFGDFAVLYRTNAQSRSLEETFIRYGIPYRIVGGHRFYDRKEIKDILAYIRFIYQSEDRSSLLRVINVPARGLGAKSVQTFFEWQEAQGLGLGQALTQIVHAGVVSPKAAKGFASLGNLITDMRAMAKEVSVATLIDGLVRRLDYLNFVNDDTLKGSERSENVLELISVAREYEELGLSGFLEEVALVSDLDEVDNKTNAITLMTMHAAKGLEYPVVFIAGMEESIFPHSRALFDQQEMEEERRLCYVGMTRAMEELYMIHASSRMLYGSAQHNPPSRFISYIDGEYNPSASYGFEPIIGATNPTPIVTESYKAGDRVRHSVFGTGTITSLDGDVATVSFQSRGAKKLNVAFAPLEKL